MRNTIYSKAVWDRKISTGVWSISMAAFALMFAWVFEIYAGEITNFSDNFPAELSAVIGDLAAATTPAGFLAVELYSLFLPLIVAIVGITFGAAAIGKEEESGTLELLLASPISRRKILVQKFGAIATVLFVIPFATWLGVVVGKSIFPFDVNVWHVALASFASFFLGMVYASAAFAGQSVSGKRGIGLGIGGGLLAVTYIADVVSKLVDRLEFLQYISPFYYFDISNVLFGYGRIGNFAVLAGLVAVFYTVVHIAFKNRDTGV